MGKVKIDAAEAFAVDADDELVDQVDHLGSLTAEYEAAKEIVKAYEALKKTLVEKATVGVSPDDGTTVVGLHHVLKVEPASWQRSVTSKKAIFEALGNEAFVKLATFKLTDLDKYLTEAQKEAALSKERTGPRKSTVAEKD